MDQNWPYNILYSRIVSVWQQLIFYLIHGSWEGCCAILPFFSFPYAFLSFTFQEPMLPLWCLYAVRCSPRSWPTWALASIFAVTVNFLFLEVILVKSQDLCPFLLLFRWPTSHSVDADRRRLTESSAGNWCLFFLLTGLLNLRSFSVFWLQTLW